jgi:hypothetical protein
MIGILCSVASFHLEFDFMIGILCSVQCFGFDCFCQVLPPSAHTVKSTASKFLLNWLFQHEHEHRQWSAAISLGLISSCLHVTDHKQKYQNITGLVEVGTSSEFALIFVLL